MRAADVEKALVGATGATFSEIDQRTRWLRNFEHPELGRFRAGRGRHAPHLNEWETAIMLLCLAARRATAAKHDALWLGSHRLTPRRLRRTERTGGSAELVDAIARTTMKDPTEVDFVYILGLVLGHVSQGITFNVSTIEMSDMGVYALITFSDGDDPLFLCGEEFFALSDEKDPILKEHATFGRFVPGDVERRVILNGIFVRNLGEMLDDGEEHESGVNAKSSVE